MIYQLLLCATLGQVSNILKKENGQRKKAGKASIIWPGWGEFLRLNGLAIALWVATTASLFAIFWRVLSVDSISNYDQLWDFWIFSMKKGIVYEVAMSLAAWGFGYAGSDAVMEWLGKSNPIINHEIEKKTPPPSQATAMPTELIKPD